MKQINIFTEMVICVAVDCRCDNSAREGINFHKFQKEENLKQQWLIKIKRRNIQLIKNARMCHT